MGTTVFERRRPPQRVVDDSLRDTALRVFWLDDVDRPTHPRLNGTVRADLAIVGGGYAGLWTAVRAKERDPERRVVLLEASRIAWAASGRNGGFCESSLTHGHENGVTRWPEEIDRLEELGHENLDGIEQTVARYGMDAEFERTGQLAVAVEPHQVEWLRDEPGFPRPRSRAGGGALRDVPRRSLGPRGLGDGAPGQAGRRAGTRRRRPRRRDLRAQHRARHRRRRLGSDHAGHGRTVGSWRMPWPSPTNVFPSLLKRNRLMTVPVYDYVLMTEPLSAEQLASIGWSNRQGPRRQREPVPLLPAHRRRPHPVRRLRRGLPLRRQGAPRVRGPHREPPQARLALLHDLPAVGGPALHPPLGRGDRLVEPLLRVLRHRRKGRITYATGFTGLGVGAARFAADVMLDTLSGAETERTELRMVREKPIPFPPEPAASIGVNLVRAAMDRADHNEGKRNLFLKTLDAVGMGFDS